MAVTKAASTMPRPTPVRPVPTPINSPAYEPPRPLEKKGPAPWRLKVGMVVPWLLGVLLAAIVLQVALGAAMALGGDYDYLGAHGAMAGILHLIPLLVIVFGFLGADKWAGIGGIVILAQVFVQFPLIEIEGAMRGMHVLNALLMFTIALLLLRDRMPWVSSAPKAPAKT